MSFTNNNSSASSPAFTPVFATAGGFEDDEIDGQLGFGLTLDSPTEFVFSNDLQYDEEELQHAAMHQEPHDDKAAFMRSVNTERDGAYGLLMPRSMEGFLETSITEANGKTPVFVLDKVPQLSPQNFSSSFDFLPTTSVDTKPTLVPASPLSPVSYVSAVEVPEKERSEFFSVNPCFTSCEAPTKIMDTLKNALAALRCEYVSGSTSMWSITVSCLVVAEEIAFSMHLFQLRGASTKYEIEFVRHSGDEVVFVDLAEHIRAQCNEIDEEGALALFSKTLDPWMDDKQELSGRRYAVKESEVETLLDELNSEFLSTDALYQVARSIKNHCRHKGNRKLFVQPQIEEHKNLFKGLKWMLEDTDEIARFAVFILQQYAQDEELCPSFFSKPIEKSSVLLSLETLISRKDTTKFTAEMVDAVRQSALFA